MVKAFTLLYWDLILYKFLFFKAAVLLFLDQVNKILHFTVYKIKKQFNLKMILDFIISKMHFLILTQNILFMLVLE